MTYWQILKQRREYLGVSVEELAYDMRLYPEYIDAIENNQLMLFSDNLYNVIPLVQRYASAVGVNYYAIAEDVESNVYSYAQRRNLPVKPPAAKRTKTAGSSAGKSGTSSSSRKRTSSSNSRSRSNARSRSGNRSRNVPASRNMTKSQKARARRRQQRRRQRIYRLGFGAAVLLIAGLLVMNFIMDQRAQNEAALAEAQRQAEIQKKEEETQRLAQQKQNGTAQSANSSSNSIVITGATNGSNLFTLTETLSKVSELNFKVQLPEPSTVLLYEDSVLKTDQYKEYISEFTYSLPVESASFIQLEITNYKGGDITLNGQTIKFDTSSYTEGEPAILYFQIVDDRTDEEKANDAQKSRNSSQSSQNSSNSSSDANTSNSSADADAGASDDSSQDEDISLQQDQDQTPVFNGNYDNTSNG